MTNKRHNPFCWAPKNAKGIVASVQRVFKTGDIRKLTRVAYDHITLNMGFIAHYNVHGFHEVYVDVDKFARKLLTSEMSGEPNYNWRQRDRYVRDGFFSDSYGMPYCQSVADANEGILRAAMKHLKVGASS